ncbi:tyrosine-protein phosphatase 10D-like [Ptychodera flava]|uniref:tyrosine-protein phosphatase 10D-like n=1 Tax=Ptychodera flava TaxID=63121 RepID=UPI00396AA17E
MYVIYIRSYSDNYVSADSNYVIQRTVPMSPLVDDITTFNSTSITVTWSMDENTTFDRFEIVYGSGSTDMIVEVNDTDSRRATLTYLVPGELYVIYMRSYSDNYVSADSNNVIQRTVPMSPLVDDITTFNSTSITVTWSMDENTTFDRFEIVYGSGSTDMIVEVNDTDSRRATLTYLVPGELYVIYMRSYSDNYVSADMPMPPLVDDITTFNSTSITVTWSMDENTTFDRFEIVYGSGSTDMIVEVNDTDVRRATLTDLVPGELYVIYIRSYSDNYVSADSNNVIQRTVPTQPQIDDITTFNSTSLTVTWSMDENTTFDRFEIVYGSGSTDMIVEVNDTDVRRATLTDLVPGELYDIYIRSYSDDYESADSNNVIQRTVPMPPQIDDITTFNSTSLTVTWSMDENTTFDRFEIVYGSGSTDMIVEVNDTDVRRATLTDLVPGEMYVIYIRSYSDNYVSADSNYVIQRTVPMSPLVDDITTFNSTSITVTWSMDENTTFDRFEIVYGSGSTDMIVEVNDTDSRRATLTYLVPGELYVIYMRSYSDNYVSADSNNVIQRTVPMPPLVDDITTFNSTSITVTWSMDENTTFDRFEIVYGSGSTEMIVEVNDTYIRRATLTDLVPGELYVIYMRSYSDNYVSAGSNNVIQRTVPMSPVVDDITTFNSTSITFTWSMDENTTFDRFEIVYGSGSTDMIVEVNDTDLRRATLTDLVPGELYVIYIRSYSDDYVSADSNNVIQRTVPMSPLVDDITTFNSTSITVTWSMDENTTFDRFEIVYGSGSTYMIVEVNDTDVRRATLTDLVPGELYDIYIRSYSDDYESADSNNVIQRTVPKPPVVDDITTFNSTSITLTWAMDENTTFDRFEIVWVYAVLPFGYIYEIIQVNDTDSRRKTLTDLVPGELYVIYMRSYIDNYVSVESNNVIQRTVPIPPLVDDITTFYSTSITVTWSMDRNTIFDRFDIVYVAGYRDMIVQVNDTYSRRANLTDLVPGELYVIYMRSYSDNYVSADSNNVIQRTVPMPPLVDDITTFNSTSITVTWSMDENTTFDRFEIVYGSGSTYMIVEVNDTDVRRATLTDLVPGELYVIYIRSYSDDYVSADSNNVIQRTVPVPPVVDDTTTFNSTSITLIWAMDENTTFDRFEIVYGAGYTYEIIQVNDTDSRRTTLTDLVPGELYVIYIRSYIDSYVSVQSNNVIQRTVPIPPLVDDITTFNSTSITVTWSMDWNTTFDRFDIVYVAGYRDMIVQVNETYSRRATLTDLVPGELYVIYMRSYSDNYVSADSNNVIQRTDPMAPITHEITTYNSTYIFVSWSMDENTIFDRFEIVYRDRSAETKVQVNETNLRNATLTDLVPGELYIIHMISYSFDQISEESSSVTQRTKPATPVINEVTSYNSTAIIVRWSVVDNTIFDRFEVVYETGTTEVKVHVNETYARNVTLAYLVPGEIYAIYMISYSQNEVSARSNDVFQRAGPDYCEDGVSGIDANSANANGGLKCIYTSGNLVIAVTSDTELP